MKRIITLLIAVAAVVSVQAQTSRDREEARRVILGNPKNGDTRGGNDRDVILGGGNRNEYPNRDNYPNSDYPYGGSREAAIDQVNREYDNKIQSVRNNPYLNNAEKQRMISQLERDRARKIKEINKRYKDGRYDDDDRDGRYDRDRRYDRKDNGKHLGWEKGKGNPHKNGGKMKKNKKSRY